MAGNWWKRVRSLMTAVAVTILLVLAGASACEEETHESKPSVEQKLKDAGLFEHSTHPKLKIGVYINRPLLGFVERGVNGGFEVDIARYVAKNLGYQGDGKIEWVTVPSVNDRMLYLERGQVDLVFASLSMIPDRCDKRILCAGPYLVTEQSVLIPTALKAKIATIQDLAKLGEKVCTAAGSTSEKLLREDRGMQVSSLNSTEECVAGVRNGTYEAVSSDRTILAGFVSRYPNELMVLNVKLGTSTNQGIERIGVGVPRNNTALRELVDYFLNKSFDNQQKGKTTEWTAAFDKHLSRWYGEQLTQPRPDNVPILLDYDAKAPKP
ncbi:MAG TPA: transporter substrate-binding domain-containing protein [Candidatus Limnocylindrales bacterium]|nr:transporter substrate-binding domain-containing protein [Candidatus Limnocylindrales bacterium]